MQIHNTPNKTISELRTKYKVTIKTFQKNGSHNGFVWFNAILLNENLFNNKKRLMHTFFHEYCHYKNKHKQWLMICRFSIPPLILLMSFIDFWVVALIILFCSHLINKMENKFEETAERYAKEEMEEYDKTSITKRKSSN